MDTTPPQSNYPSYPTPPPPSFSPPPVITPPPPSKPRKSRGWMIIAIILFVLLGVSMLFNLGGMMHSLSQLDGGMSREVGPKLDEVVLKDKGARDKIAVVPIEGIISSELVADGHSLVDIVKAQLDRAADDRRVKAVILKVDSPGGEVLASDEIHHAIVQFQDKENKPVICSMGGLAASGGYYVAAPCRYIVAHDLTITGSIGVIMSTINYRGLMDKVGISPYTFKSGKYKDMLSPMREKDEIPEGEREMVQRFINETYARFRNIVKEGRQNAAKENKEDGSQLASDWQDYADGRILSGQEALKLGFVDKLGNFDDAVDKTLEIAGIEKANIVEYRVRHEFGDLLRLFGKTESRAVKVDIGIEAPKLQAGRAYYLYLP